MYLTPKVFSNVMNDDILTDAATDNHDDDDDVNDDEGEEEEGKEGEEGHIPLFINLCISIIQLFS